MANDRLEQLLDVWMSDRDRGVVRTATEICADNPELVEELARRIRVVSQFEQLADVGNSDTLRSQVEIDTSHSGNAPPSAIAKGVSLPEMIGGFKPLSILGEGGMGAVYLAEDSQLGRRVAIKVMKKELAADPDARHRFLREARAMATIEHDNIMIIHAVGEDHGTPFLVMPVLKGETLDDRLCRENRLPVAESCRIGREIAAGLAAAHSHGLIHRDIKPSNIWLEGSQGRVRILDFGLARPASDDQKVTQSGAVLGTPAYMAPEQAAGTEATLRSDLFSLGAVLYRITTGQQPFAGPNILATLNNLANRIPESPAKLNSEIPAELSTLIDRLMAKAPERRAESADAVVQSLQSIERLMLQSLTTSEPALMSSERKNIGDETKKSVSPRPLESPANRRPRIPRNIVMSGLAVLLLLFAIIVYRIVTDRGTLVLAIEESDQMTARLDKGALVVADARNGRTWRLFPNEPKAVPSGDYKLPSVDGLLLNVMDSSGAEFSTKEFSISRGEERIVYVTLDRTPVVVDDQNDATLVRDITPFDWQGWPTDSPAPAIAPFDAAQATQHQKEWAQHFGVPVQYTNSIGMEFVLIPAGEFTMGITNTEINETKSEANSEERQHRIQSFALQHKVILTRPFYLGIKEVTQLQYHKVIGKNPSRFAKQLNPYAARADVDSSDHPVETVNWNDAVLFCETLTSREEHDPINFQTGEQPGYRLPTEAEWEFACRAGVVGTKYSSGNSEKDLSIAGWYTGNSDGETHPVGRLSANPFGLHDMHGNVAEWVSDWFDLNYYTRFQTNPAVSPAGPSQRMTKRIFRGGSWADPGFLCRASNRDGFEPSVYRGEIGFRVTISVDAVKAARPQ